MNKNKINSTRQTGVTLIEVLVAALVLAIGLVGLAGLNLRALQSAHSAYYSSVAGVIAVDAEERLWVKLGQDGLINSTTLNVVQSELAADWGFTGLPELDITVTQDTTLTATEWLDVNIVVNWAEGRFANAGTESFGFKTRVPSGPISTGP